MEEEDIDLVLASSEKNFGYLSGYIHPFTSDYIPVNDIGEPDVHYAGIPREGTKDPFMVQNSYASFLEMREPWIKDRRYYGSSIGVGMDRFDIEQPIKIVAEALKERGLERATIGLELEQGLAQTKDTMKVPVMERLKKFLPKATFVEGGRAIMKARMIKSPEELQKIRQAVKASEKAFSVAFEIRPRGDDRDRHAQDRENNTCGAERHARLHPGGVLPIEGEVHRREVLHPRDRE